MYFVTCRHIKYLLYLQQKDRYNTEGESKMNREEKMVVVEIAKRADALGIMMFDRMSLMMDVEAVHAEIGLKLDELLNADEANFTHDIVGIQKNLDRESKKLQNFFLPRYAK